MTESMFDLVLASKIALMAAVLFAWLTTLLAPDLPGKQRATLLACGCALSCMFAVGAVGAFELIREERARHL
jgi:hypothetical protein